MVFRTHFLILISFLASSSSFGQKDYSAELLTSTQRGDASAQNQLGIAYSEELARKANQTEAVNWFRKKRGTELIARRM